jgi:hypothetical protein
MEGTTRLGSGGVPPLLLLGLLTVLGLLGAVETPGLGLARPLGSTRFAGFEESQVNVHSFFHRLQLVQESKLPFSRLL